MNIEFHILIGQPRAKAGESAKRELQVIGTYPSRSELSQARGKVKPEDFAFTGEINTSSTRLRNRRVLTLPPPAEPPVEDNEEEESDEEETGEGERKSSNPKKANGKAK